MPELDNQEWWVKNSDNMPNFLAHPHLANHLSSSSLLVVQFLSPSSLKFLHNTCQTSGGNSHGTQPATARPDWDKCFPIGNGRRAGQEDCFLNPFVHRRTAVAHSEPTKAFSKRRPETAMLSAPFGCTHPPPPIPPFLLKQNLAIS